MNIRSRFTLRVTSKLHISAPLRIYLTARRGVAAMDWVPGDAVSASHETVMKGSRAMKSLERARVRAIGLSITAALDALAVSATPAFAEPSEHPFGIEPGSFHLTTG